MLRNISDYLSLMTLLFISAYAIYAFLLSFRNPERDEGIYNRRQLLRDYLDNEEE